MESLKSYSLGLSEEAYHELPVWSYSKIAKYAREGFGSLPFLHSKSTPTEAMRFGSLFDSVMTRGKATLDQYTVSATDIPDAERKALEYIYTSTGEPFKSIEPTKVDRLCDECSYHSNWGIESRLKHLKLYSGYYDQLLSGKILISEKDWMDAMAMYHAVKDDTYLGRLFKAKDADGIEYIYQAQFQEEVRLPSNRTAEVKVMLDLIVVNHNDKTIQPVDLKSMSQPSWQFKQQFLRMRYDLQAAVYTDILTIVANKLGYHDYTILPFVFAAISREDRIPLSFVYDTTCESQQNGLCYESGGKTYRYKHWTAMLDEILSYEEAHASVPSNIVMQQPNNLIDLLNE